MFVPEIAEKYSHKSIALKVIRINIELMVAPIVKVVRWAKLRNIGRSGVGYYSLGLW